MIYVISLLCGIVPNGVDKAQGYRNRLFNNLGLPARYVFLRQPSKRDIDYHHSNGILREQMIALPQTFTDNGDVGFEMKDYYANGHKVRTEYYADTLIYADDYSHKGTDGLQDPIHFKRTYYNRDGSVGLEEQILPDSSRGNLYIMPDGGTYYEGELWEPFAARLELLPTDTVIIDTPSIHNVAIPFYYMAQARIIVVLHSGHYHRLGEDPSSVTLHSDYMYLFKYSDLVDTIVVSTEEQKRDLLSLADSYGCTVNNIAVIPAGGVEHLRHPKGARTAFSILTVSRIDQQKRIDWVIKAVIKAHEQIPVSLDIYGDVCSSTMTFLNEINDIITRNGADYICLKGFVDVTEVYTDYSLYVTASLCESLGLSLMEAVASGCAMVGLDVHYGNRLFIEPDKNGFLVDFDLDRMCEDHAYEEDVIDLMAKRIVDVFSDEKRLQRFNEYSYEIAKRFESEKIEAMWRKLLI